MLSVNRLERRLQLAGIVVILGLVVQGVSLIGHGPIAFLTFVGIGGLFLAAGILFYLVALVS